MRVLMLVAGSVVADVRVLREAAALVDAGHDVHVVGRDVPAGGTAGPGVALSSASGGDGLRRGATRVTGRPPVLHRAARWVLLPEHRRRTFSRWAAEARPVASRLGCDVVHAHDYTALGLGARLAREKGVPLVYDAHELWAERHRAGRPTPLLRRWERARERRLGARASVVLTVGDALADRLRASYRWADVRVVRNTFPVSRSATALPPSPVAAVYAGRLAAGRDLATVAAASASAGLAVRLLGPQDLTWMAGFDPGAAQVEPAVHPTRVEDELRAAGLALVTLEEGWGNHEVALPNKLFQAVSAGVPVVASDVGELARTVRRHDLGAVYPPGDPVALAAAIEQVRARYVELRTRVREAQPVLSWTADRARLLGAYGAVSARPRQAAS